MTTTDRAAATAAEVAARYGIPVDPAVVKFIPSGVSGLPDPSLPSLSWKEQTRASMASVQRKARLAKADGRAAKPQADREAASARAQAILAAQRAANSERARQRRIELAAKIKARMDQFGETIAAAGEALGIGRNLASDAMRTAYPDMPRRRSPGTGPKAQAKARAAGKPETRADAIRRMHRDGMVVADIARHFGIQANKVRLDLGLKTTEAERLAARQEAARAGHAGKVAALQADAERLREAVQTAGTVDAAARELGLNKHRARKIAARFGIKGLPEAVVASRSEAGRLANEKRWGKAA